MFPIGIVSQQEPFAVPDLSPSLWLDETTTVLSGNNVTSWNNAGSLGGSFDPGISPSINSTHLNSLDVVTFGNLHRLVGTAELLPILNNRAQFWFFYLYRQTGATGDEVICHISENAGSGSRQSILAGVSNFNSRFGGRRVDGSTFSSRTSATAYNNTWAMMLGYNDYQAATVSLWVNGVKEGPTTGAWGGGSANTPANNSAGVWVGMYTNSTSALNGDIAEIIAGHNALTDSDINKVFGFAAHKWGLTDSLPSGHPYKTSPP